MRTIVCLAMLLIFGSVSVACPAPAVAVAVGAPQTYCPAPQADPVVNPPLGVPLRLETPQVYNQTQTQVLRLATNDYSYNNSRNVQLLRADNGYYRTRNVAIVNHNQRVAIVNDNHRNNNVAIVRTGRTRLSVDNGNATVVNVQSRSGLFGLRRTNTQVVVGGGGPAVGVRVGGPGPRVAVKAGGGGRGVTKTVTRTRTRTRTRSR